LYRAIFSLLPAFVEGLAVLVLICAKTSPAVGATAAAVATVFVALSGAVMKARIPIMRRLLQQEGTANGYAEDALSLAETVAAFGATEQEISRYASALAGVSRAAITVRFSFSALKMMQASLLGIGACCIAFVTWKEATNQLLSVSQSPVRASAATSSSVAGQLILVQALFAQLCAPLDHVGQHFRDCVSAAEDLRELECIKAAGATSLEKQARLADDVAAAAAAAAAPALTSTSNFLSLGANKSRQARPPPRLELRDLHFAYASVDPRPRDDVVADTMTAAGASTTTTTTATTTTTDSERVETERVILRGISFSVPSGGYSVGIVGPSGSGKSTLLRVLLGLESVAPIGSNTNVTSDCATSSSSSRGQLLVDGVDVTSRHRVPLFSMVGQESDLFRSLDLAGNVRYGTKSSLATSPDGGQSTSADATADLRALSNAARDAQLEPLLSALPGGWSAAVGPRGRLLSGGERQRVCLARALYRQELTGGILLMDEVTASLDAQTESLVTRAILGRVKQGATAVLIAHRLSSVRDCDLILVLRDGVVMERGSHSQLMRKGGWYAQSVRLQRDS